MSCGDGLGGPMRGGYEWKRGACVAVCMHACLRCLLHSPRRRLKVYALCSSGPACGFSFSGSFSRCSPRGGQGFDMHACGSPARMCRLLRPSSPRHGENGESMGFACEVPHAALPPARELLPEVARVSIRPVHACMVHHCRSCRLGRCSHPFRWW